MSHEHSHSELSIATHDGELLTLDDKTRRQHLHIIGASGTGKTTLIKHMLAQDLAGGRGVALIDPLGHLAEAAIALVPTSRAHEFVYLNPADLDRPIGLNIAENAPPDQHAMIADDILAAFIHVFGKDAVGERSQQVLRNSIRALLCSPNTTLLCIPRLLTDETYRSRIVRRISDPVVLAYWTKQFEPYSAAFREQVTAPILNKLDAVLSAPELRNIIGQPKSTIDVRKILDEHRILFVNLNKARIGENNAHILGAFVATLIAQAAFARAEVIAKKIRQREPLQLPTFYMYADEFQDFISGGFKRILSQARNYLLALTLAHQYLGQLPDDLRQAVFGNAASFLSFRVGAEDAPMIAAHLGLKSQVETSGLGYRTTEPEQQLTHLPNYHAYFRTLIDEMPTVPIDLEMPPPPSPINHRPHRLITNSRVRFGRDRVKIETAIAHFLRQ